MKDQREMRLFSTVVPARSPDLAVGSVGSEHPTGTQIAVHFSELIEENRD
jgi:hypothetical protein